MRILFCFGILACFVLSAFSQTASFTTLQSLRGRARVVLVFAPSLKDPGVSEQLEEMKAHATEAIDRDLLVVVVPELGPNGPIGAATLAPDEAVAARKRLHIAPGEFVVILIGKDGGEKMRSKKPLSFHRLREAIDAMPMRRQEMKEKSAAGLDGLD